MILIIVNKFFGLLMNAAGPNQNIALPVLGFLTGIGGGVLVGLLIVNAYHNSMMAINSFRSEKLLVQYYDELVEIDGIESVDGEREKEIETQSLVVHSRAE